MHLFIVHQTKNGGMWKKWYLNVKIRSCLNEKKTKYSNAEWILKWENWENEELFAFISSNHLFSCAIGHLIYLIQLYILLLFHRSDGLYRNVARQKAIYCVFVSFLALKTICLGYNQLFLHQGVGGVL